MNIKFHDENVTNPKENYCYVSIVTPESDTWQHGGIQISKYTKPIKYTVRSPNELVIVVHKVKCCYYYNNNNNKSKNIPFCWYKKISLLRTRNVLNSTYLLLSHGRHHTHNQILPLSKSLLDLSQKSIIGWQFQVILGVAIFSQQTHLRSFHHLLKQWNQIDDIKIRKKRTNPSSEMSISW